jgi:hypothetical protein
VVIAFMTAAVGGVLQVRQQHRAPPLPPGGLLLIIALWLVISSWLFAALTNNAPEQAFGLIGLAAGLAMAGLSVNGKSAAPEVLSPASPWRAGRRVRSAVVVLGGAGLIGDAVLFHRTVNLPRTVHEMHVDAAALGTWTADVRMSPVMKAVGFSLWTAQSKYTSAATSLPALIEYLRGQRGNFLMLGDETIIYGLTGKPSPTPFLWFHPGLVWADTSHAEMNAWLELNLSRHDVRTIILPANVGVLPWEIGTFDAVASRMPPRSACRGLGDYLLCPVEPP